MGDIRPYDHDAGVSFLVDSATSQAFTELDTRKSGIRIEAGIKELRFNNVSVDLIPWRAENTSNGVTTKVILHKAYSQVDVLLRAEGILAGHYHKLQSFPQSWAVPPKQVNFHGVSVSVPNSAACILADRYLYTFGAFGVQFPCKWKCWVPCSLRIRNGC